ncbi:hypothetical protein LRL17_10420 [Rhodococcus qingshengii]|uniref:hypothetical protein n=1 Tax=Rhodococcus qingshengii TaxID=334542 RepID=UPI001E4268BA|nr:hypothetical protein [Rhodococcus qingshengii]UGQ55183.1 hypothetical protein LRL17_10420 [Rhodococcus qingshengii]
MLALTAAASTAVPSWKVKPFCNVISNVRLSGPEKPHSLAIPGRNFWVAGSASISGAYINCK